MQGHWAQALYSHNFSNRLLTLSLNEFINTVPEFVVDNLINVQNAPQFCSPIGIFIDCTNIYGDLKNRGVF